MTMTDDEREQVIETLVARIDSLESQLAAFQTEHFNCQLLEASTSIIKYVTMVYTKFGPLISIDDNLRSAFDASCRFVRSSMDDGSFRTERRSY